MRIRDFHNDCLTALDPARFYAYLEANAAVRVTCALWTYGRNAREALALAKRVNGIANADLAVEDCGCFAPAEWDALFALAPLSVGLTWNYDNAYAGGALEAGGLSAEGRGMIAELNRRGIAVDLAHLNRASFFEALERAERPVVTHTALDCLYPHPRNLTDEQIRALTARGGLVGLALVASFYGEGAVGAEAWVRAADTFCCRFGAEYLAIGTDFYGTDRYLGAPPVENYTNLVQVVEKLRGMGYNEETLNAIAGGNIDRFTEKSHARVL